MKTTCHEVLFVIHVIGHVHCGIWNQCNDKFMQPQIMPDEQGVIFFKYAATFALKTEAKTE
jgi:hypothetical protein